MASMYALSSSRPRASRSLAPQMSQIEMEVNDALNRMMFAIGNGDVATYRQIVDVEFPKQLKPRMSTSYHKLLKEYIHPRDGSDFQDMTPLQAAVFSGKPELVDLVLQLHNDIEYATPGVIHEILENKTARGMADVFIANSKTPEQAAPFKAIKKSLLLNGAKPKMVSTIMGKKLAFPENKANVNEYKRVSNTINSIYRNSRKGRKTRKSRKNKTRRA